MVGQFNYYKKLAAAWLRPIRIYKKIQEKFEVYAGSWLCAFLVTKCAGQFGS